MSDLPPALSPSKSRWVFLPIALLYLLSFPYHPGLHSPNELSRLWQTRALVEFKSLSLNETLQTYGPVGDLSFKDGKYYSSKAPLLSFAAVPIYWVLRTWGGGGLFAVPELPLVYWSRLFLTVLPTLGMLLLLRKFLLAHLMTEEVANALVATYALGTLAFSYSLAFMSHQTSAVLVFTSFYCLWRTGDPSPFRRSRRAYFIYAGGFAGAAVAAEYTSALGVLCLLAFGALLEWKSADGTKGQRALRVARALGWASLGAAPFVLFLMGYHQAAFGHPLESGYKHLADAGYQPWHLGGFLGIRTPDPRAFALSFFSPLRGLFMLAPFLLLALPGLRSLWRSAHHGTEQPRNLATFWCVVLLLLGYAYFTSSFSYESWGWTTGPRHLTGLVPFLLLPIGLLLNDWALVEAPWSRWAIAGASGLCASSIVVTGLLSLVNYIPDMVSSPLFGLAVPLFREGLLPPSALLFLGLTNPWAGGFLLLLLLSAAVGVLWMLNEARPRLWGVVAGLGIVAGVLLIHRAATRLDDGDIGAQAHLRSVWLAPPGQRVDFWP